MAIVTTMMRQKMTNDAAYERQSAAIKRAAKNRWITICDAGEDICRRIGKQTRTAVQIDGRWIDHTMLRGWRDGYPHALPWSCVRLGDRIETIDA